MNIADYNYFGVILFHGTDLRPQIRPLRLPENKPDIKLRLNKTNEDHDYRNMATGILGLYFPSMIGFCRFPVYIRV